MHILEVFVNGKLDERVEMSNKDKFFKFVEIEKFNYQLELNNNTDITFKVTTSEYLEAVNSSSNQSISH